MLPCPLKWRRIEVGEDLILLPPEGASCGVIRYRERLRPLLPVVDLVAGQLADDPQFAVDRVEPPRDLVTAEGERAALASVTGTLDGRRVQRYLGFVLGDDFYARVGALALAPDHFERFRTVTQDLVFRATLRLGRRRRRLEYQPPAGWREHAVGLRSDWLRPEFPADPSCLTVWPASPNGPVPDGPPPAVPATGIAGPWPMRTRGGLKGWTWRSEWHFTDGRTRRRDLVLLADDRYRYAVRLDTTPDHHEAHRQELLALLDSLRPVPRPPAPARPTAGEVVEHWTE